MASGLIPLFPLQVVVFPGMPLPLHIFEERYKEMVGKAIREKSEFGIVLAREDGIVNAGCTVVVEKLFSWPGLGSLLVDSIFQRDIPVTQGCILLIILAFLVINLAVDLLYTLIDPRIEYNK